jgi:hypothetical protein
MVAALGQRHVAERRRYDRDGGGAKAERREGGEPQTAKRMQIAHCEYSHCCETQMLRLRRAEVPFPEMPEERGNRERIPIAEGFIVLIIKRILCNCRGA